MQPLISVIVPVYKVEEYLPRCLNSICRQSLKEIEIILVDDASPDRCGEICEQYAAKDSRCKVIHHTENKGLSAARNTGIRQASADYLMFVDSDDWVHEDFCKAAYECAVNNHADLVMFNYQLFQGKTFKRFGHNNIKTGYKSREEGIELLLLLRNYAVWNKLFCKKLFDGVCFPEGYLFEDVGTTYKLFWKATSIYYLDKSLYYYYRNPKSITLSKMSSKALNDWFEMHLQLYNGLLSKGYSKEKTDIFFQKIALTYCIKKQKDFSNPYYALSADMIRSIKKTPQGLNYKRKYLVKLFQWSPKLFNLLCSLLKKQID